MLEKPLLFPDHRVLRAIKGRRVKRERVLLLKEQYQPLKIFQNQVMSQVIFILLKMKLVKVMYGTDQLGLL
jgi:hypothetical protein